MGIDANGILNVSAVEKAGGKQEKITITNDKGRLSAEEIERMVNDAEKYKEDDDKQKDRISAKNGLESYCFNMKSTLEDDKLKDKIGENDRKTILDKCNETISWLDNNQTAETDEFQHKQKKLRASVIQSFQSCINSLVVCLMEECQMELEHLMDKVLDPLLKKLINFAYHFI